MKITRIIEQTIFPISREYRSMDLCDDNGVLPEKYRWLARTQDANEVLIWKNVRTKMFLAFETDEPISVGCKFQHDGFDFIVYDMTEGVFKAMGARIQ